MSRPPTFFTTGIEEDVVTLRGEAYHHLRNVLRSIRGDRVILTDGHRRVAGTVYEMGRGYARIAVEGEVPSPDGGVPIVLAQGIAKGKKMDWIVEKATELGVRRIVPLAMERSVPRYDDEASRRRRERWTRHAQAACRQSGNLIPIVERPQPLSEFLGHPFSGLGLLLWEEAPPGSLHACLARKETPTEIRVIVGPEGGITPQEVEAAVGAGYLSVSLGPARLRTETAALSILAIVQHRFGVLG
ncbi:MAG: 16S rRNA (uracil(1498)-N(3))-methyltransferase [Deltaproteobacteria bacterium]|nr:MAG: 16S rRNA (uracil(1498)-N(3))-methyltransferase [Deltaproteobacteria bacterium]